MMEWGLQSAFFLLIPTAAIVIWILFFAKNAKPALYWSSLKGWKSLSFSFRVVFHKLPFILQWVATILLITSLARPQESSVSRMRSLDGIDIMIVCDISFSMMVQDMNPGTRLAGAGTVIQQFIDGLSSDRVGLVLFSGESYTKVPLTLDYDLLKKEALGLKTSPDIEMGTAIGVAIANATARLRHSKAKSRVIILLTDGDNNAGGVSPDTAVSMAKGYGIKIYSIGIGRQGKARIPIQRRDFAGNPRTVYAVIDSKINTQLLQRMSKETGGQFYLAQNLKTLQAIFDDIGQLEKSLIQVKDRVSYKEHFQKFLKPAVSLYALSLILSLVVFGRTL